MTSKTKWFFARGGQQDGPVALGKLKELIMQGQVTPGDFVWREGMGSWAPAGEVPELLGNSVLAIAPAAEPACAEPVIAEPGPAPIGYYAPTAGIPERVLVNLRGHGRPRGDISDWPLDDLRLNQFDGAIKLRRKITAAASLYRLLLLMTTLFFIIVSIVAGSALLEQNRQKTARGAIPVIIVMLGICVLYYFTERDTRRSKQWAPLTMFILFFISGMLQIISMGLVARTQNMSSSVGPGVTLLVMLIFNVAFAVLSIRAFMTIPRYLAQPTWCQELIAKAGL
ncbi:MAG TPA: DUF4339 domain-containing protein [Tepidisphaeraceae bacterium]|jgi:hypothetical protein|nr:DUF4339 domain-containing protein [Tepidisphaeraceae bacterium]